MSGGLVSRLTNSNAGGSCLSSGQGRGTYSANVCMYACMYVCMYVCLYALSSAHRALLSEYMALLPEESAILSEDSFDLALRQ